MALVNCKDCGAQISKVKNFVDHCLHILLLAIVEQLIFCLETSLRLHRLQSSTGRFEG